MSQESGRCSWEEDLGNDGAETMAREQCKAQKQTIACMEHVWIHVNWLLGLAILIHWRPDICFAELQLLRGFLGIQIALNNMPEAAHTSSRDTCIKRL